MNQLRVILFAVPFLISLVCAPGLHAQVSGQWDFNSGDLSATVGAALTYADGPGGATAAGTSFGSTTTFGIPNIGGSVGQVMKFPSAPNGLGFNMPTPNSANGGGGLVNDWTLIMDLLYPATSDGAIRSLIEADGGLINREPEFIINDSNGVGVSPGGPFDGSIHSNTWYRIAIVVDTTAGLIRKYVNGVEVGIQASGAADDRFALNVSGNALILGSLTNAAAGGYVNSIQLRGSALNAGQIEALGGPTAAGIPQVIPPVPSFIETRTPSVNATGVGPTPDVSVTLNSGDTTVTTSSIKLFFDTVQVPATVVPAGATHSITYSVTNLLGPLSVHTLSLVYQDSVAGNKTNSWSFTVTDYQNITLPPPIVFENFESVGEGNLPPGWVVTNATTSEVPGFDLDDPDSDTYKDFVVISTDRMTTEFGGNRPLFNPIAVNGVLLTAISDGNLLYADSDQRSGANNQVNVAFSPDYNLTGHSNIFLSFHNLYEQNQDSIASVEFSIDGGTNWLPALYMLQCCIDGQDPVADIHRLPDGTIDAVATMNFVDGGSAYNLPYGAFIAAPISQALAPYISPRVNDDDYESKRVEVIRLPQADGRSKVRLRFMQAGTSSWYFGIDDLGFYSINTPVITTQPASQSIDAGTPVTFTVAAIGDPPLTYQWQHAGFDIPGATSNSFTIASVGVGDAGAYTVTVRNPSGPKASSPAQLTVVSSPSFLSLPLSQVVDPGSSVSLIVSARGGRPLTYQWLQNNNPIPGATSTNYTIASAQLANSGLYSLMISNSFGVLTGATARVTVFSGSITQALVAHLNFENNLNDTSGHNNNGSAVGAPDFAPGKIGSSALRFTTLQDGSSYNYVTLGTPPDLDFGLTNDFSASIWAKFPPNSWKGDPALVANKNWGSGGNIGWVTATDTDGHFQWNYREAAPNNRRDYDGPAGLFSDNNWHHIVVVFVRAGNALTYVDGASVNVQPLVFGLNPPSSIDSGLPTNIGQDGTGTYTDGNGVGVTNALADDLGIWRRALTAKEAASIYAQGLQGKDLTTASIAPQLRIGSVAASGSDIVMSWTGGTAPFLVQAKASLSDTSWTDVGTTSNRTFRVPMTGASRFFRISDQATNSVTTLRATLNGAAERPTPSATAGQGIATLSLEGNTLFYSVSFSNLAAAATASHIHGPADANNFANVAQGFTGVPAATAGSFSGTIAISDTVKGYILTGNAYINIHSGAFPNGEIRGQILIDAQ